MARALPVRTRYRQTAASGMRASGETERRTGQGPPTRLLLEHDMSKKQRQVYWHYTTMDRFHQIVESGHIRPATAGVPVGERPVVWFSTRQDWKPTASKLLVDSTGNSRRATKDECDQLSGGLVRIGVDGNAALCDWQSIRRRAPIARRAAKALEEAARFRGSDSSCWYGTFDIVPTSKWVFVEVLKGGNWKPLAWQEC